jgi:hypothetical protein
MQQTPINLQQQYEVCQVQPADLQQTYYTQFLPLSCQLATPQQTYCSHFPPLPSQQDTMQVVVTPHVVHEEDLEPANSSDNGTKDPIHEWQLVSNAKKKKREQSQKQDDKTKQPHITTSNRFGALSQQNGNSNNDQAQPTTQPIPKPPPIFICGVLNCKKMIDNLSNVTEEET